MTATIGRFRKAQLPLLALLASIQFAHILDFVVIMPLGPQLIRVLDIGTTSFGLLVSAYNLSAATATLIGAFVLDRVDRRTAMLWVFAGFLLGTVACGLATGALSLIAARVVAGAFGGLIQALLFAIIADCFEESRRGAAIGTVTSAFSVASVIGVPIALSVADAHGWRAPFLLLGGVSFFTWLAAWKILPEMESHLRSDLGSEARHQKGHFLAFWSLVTHPGTMPAFGLIICLMFAGFTVIPFMSTYLVGNVGLSEADLATVFLAGGVATFMTARLTGRLADHFGKTRVFTWLAGGSIVPIFILTHLPEVPVAAAIFVSTLFTVLISARAIPALALITSSVDRTRRGSFLSLTSSVQQAASGIASLVAGTILGMGSHGEILRYGLVGNVAVLATLLAIVAAKRLNHRISRPTRARAPLSA